MASRTYGIVWRWHFLAGLIACPIVAVLAITGALYVFQPELEQAAYAELREVEPRGVRKPVDELIASAPEACRRGSIEVPIEPDLAMRVWCPGDGKQSAFIDPYTGVLLGHETWDHTIFGFILKIHWELLLGETGRLVVEWATSWTVVLLITGALLWWPVRRGGGKWWPRRGVAPRQRLRDLHSVFGAYMMPALLIVAATGLFWTRLAGEDRWGKVSTDPADDVWSKPPTSQAAAGRPRIGYDRALALAGIDTEREWRGVSIWIGEAPTEAYTIYASSRHHDAPWATTITFVDAYTGARLRTVGWSERSLLNQISNAGYSIHVGSILALPGRILALIATLVLAGLCVTGPWMWWKRRPRGKLGVPPRADRFSWPLLATLAALGWLMPTVGYSLLAFGACELAVAGIRRLRAPRM